LTCQEVVHQGEGGAVLVETALGVALILMVALPFAALVGYGATSARDLATAHAAVRDAARTKTLGDPRPAYTCGATASTADGPCAAALVRGTYVAAAIDTPVSLPFGLVLHTNARAVARVG
jgi:hypothetical protein